ncbi:MAG TPA: hypothetical protein VJU86_02475 [Pyrinomonadaceae bacterium]|nr:hypothetical protein [Pyrinomonadaceae bacterium]
MASVALICTANRCRSVIAHAILLAEAKQRSIPVEVYSAGIFDFRDAPPIHDTTATCASRQTPAPDKAPTWICELPLDSITRFLVMEQFHAHTLINGYGISPDRVSLLGDFDPKERGAEIDDPYAQSRTVYDECYDRIRDCIVNYLDTTNDLKETGNSV